MANTKVTKAVLADDAVGLAQLDITNDPSDGQALTAEAVSDGYNLTWADNTVSSTPTFTNATFSSATPSIQLTDTDNNADAYIQGTDGNIKFFADDNGEASSTEITFALDGTQRAKIDASGDFTATNVYAGGSAVQDGTQKKNYGNTTSYPNGSTDSFTLSASEAPIGSWVNLGIYISSGNSGGDQYCYLRQTNGYGSYLYGYVDSWYYTFAASNWWYIGAAGDRTFSIVHGTIVATNSNDFRRILYFGYKMDN